MRIITHIADMQSLADSLRRENRRIGFVPTMGYLHEGHMSLIRQARKEADVVVVSIFVNPTQFGPSEDFNRYPRDKEGDLAKCNAVGADIVFIPDAMEMYSDQYTVFVTVEGISDILEGAVRPGHYRGVATVVAKLFHIVKPHVAFFGQKDYQQCIIIKRMVKGLNMDVNIAVQPTIREVDGLAMSSRNAYLNAEERRAAAAIFRALSAAASLVKSGVKEIEQIRNKMQTLLLENKGLSIDYIQIADPETLVPQISVMDSMVILVAIRLGSTRLIDNIEIRR
ncbi:MAG TPA: pantoate--beta-alanine ligase [Nitrospirota bacterium]|nr:pantoate--beta-alanine ligase [Nitrospirota bacterium]